MANRSQFEQDDRLNATYFDSTARQFGEGHLAVDWGSEASQKARFDQFCSMLPIQPGSSVLDVGCGVGGFLDYLNAKPLRVDYRGIDVSDEMIRICRERHADHEFHLGSILEAKLPQFDTLVASGIFNRRQQKPEDFLMATVETMFRLCNRGIAFNCLSTHADKREPDEFHADPLAVIARCQSLTTHIRYDHSYLPHDFTIALMKAP